MLPRIVSAAIRHPNGQVFTLPAPYRHHHVVSVMWDLGIGGSQNVHDQGFMTSTGEYLDRTAALLVALNAGQLGIHRPKTFPLSELFSEDLW